MEQAPETGRRARLKKQPLYIRIGTPALAAVALLLAVALVRRMTKGPLEPPQIAREIPAAAPGVFPVNQHYHRARSRVLMRRVVGPTMARLDFAAYDANMFYHDPTEYDPRLPEETPALKSLHFGVLDADSLCDRLEETPLTDDEEAYPMSWEPVTAWLELWDAELASGLVRAGAEVAAETWNDEDVYNTYQEISRVYLHHGDDGAEMWARVEFKPWVKFLSGVGDEDGDGYPEIYGRFRAGVFRGELVEPLVSDYMTTLLDRKAMAKWVYNLGEYWYKRYNTEALDVDELEGWPDEKTRADLGEELAELPKEPPSMVICAKVEQTRFLYLVLYVE